MAIGGQQGVGLVSQRPWVAVASPAPPGGPALPDQETGTWTCWEVLQATKKIFFFFFIKASVFKLEVFPNNNL